MNYTPSAISASATRAAAEGAALTLHQAAIAALCKIEDVQTSLLDRPGVCPRARIAAILRLEITIRTVSREFARAEDSIGDLLTHSEF